MQKSVEISRFQRSRRSKVLKEEYFLAVQNSKLKDTLHKYKLLKKLSADRLNNYIEREHQYSQGLSDLQSSLKQELQQWNQAKKLQIELDSLTMKLSEQELNFSKDKKRNTSIRKDIAALEQQIQHNITENQKLISLFQQKKERITSQMLHSQQQLDQVLQELSKAQAEYECLKRQNQQSSQNQDLFNKLLDLRIIQQQMLNQNQSALQAQAYQLIQLQTNVKDYTASLSTLENQLFNLNRLIARQHDLIQQNQKQTDNYRMGDSECSPVFVNLSKRRNDIINSSAKSDNALLIELSRRRLSTEGSAGVRSSRFRRIVLPQINKSLTKR